MNFECYKTINLILPAVDQTKYFYNTPRIVHIVYILSWFFSEH